jgi:hypothetical protein
MWLANWTIVVPIGFFAFALLLFPTGQLRSRRWRPAAWFVGGVFALWAVARLAEATIDQDPEGRPAASARPAA